MGGSAATAVSISGETAANPNDALCDAPIVATVRADRRFEKFGVTFCDVMMMATGSVSFGEVEVASAKLSTVAAQGRK